MPFEKAVIVPWPTRRRPCSRRGGDGVWDGTVELNSDQVPAVMPVGILWLESLVNAWDFAITTGRQVVVSELVTEYVREVAGKVITPAARNYAGFAEPVAIGSIAPVLDRLIAFTGRRPAAIPAAAN